MKKITIGRGRECDIRLGDTTDKVSRRQAVITVSPTGKMMIYDTSANGTFVNGEKVEKPAGKPIKRGDNINFAHLVDLDWDEVKNPYKRTWTLGISFIVIILALAAILFIWGDALFSGEEKKTPEMIEVETTPEAPVDQDLQLEIPEDKPAPGPVASPGSQKGSKAKDTPRGKEASPESEPSLPAPPVDSPDPSLERMMNQK